MKRIPAVIALTAALSFGVSAHAQTSFADVPAGHWAQEAIKRAVDCGIILGYPDGTFRGKQAITRYEAAAMIGRLLDAIKEGKCGLTGTGAPVEMDTAAMEALQNAVQELSADLADQGVRISELEDNAVSQDDLSRVEELATEARDLAEAAAAGGGEAGVSAEDFAALQDQVTSVEELAQEARDLAEANAGGGDGGASAEDIAALIDQVEAAGIAADTALAQSRDLQDSVDALSGRVDDLESQLGELGATVEGQADSIAALNDLVVLLNQDVLSLQDRVGALEGQIEDINAQLEQTASADDLEALREFTTLLRRDQTALADRVSDLEARVGATEKKNAEQDARLGVLENNGFTISGSISLGYYVSRTYFNVGNAAGPNFDIDRLGFSTAFSSGQDKDKDKAATRYIDFGDNDFSGDDKDVNLGNVVNGNGILVGSDGNVEGKVTPGFSINMKFGKNTLTEDSKGYQTFPLVLNLEGKFADTTDFKASGGDNINPLNFKLTKLETKFTVGASPLTVAFGVKPGFKFSNYAFNNGGGRGDGFVAAAELPFLGLKLTGVYGSKSGDVFGTAVTIPVAPAAGGYTVASSGGGNKITFPAPSATKKAKVIITFSNGSTVERVIDAGATSFNFATPDGATTASPAIAGGTIPGISSVTFATLDSSGAANGDFVYYRGVKGSASIINGLEGGVFWAQEQDDIVAPQGLATSVIGGYVTGKAFGFLNLDGEYTISDVGGVAPAIAGNKTVAYVKVGADLGFLNLGVNYRAIGNDFSAIGGDGAYVYKTNQVGFGVDAAVSLGFITVGGYYDSRGVADAGSSLGNGPKSDTQAKAGKNADGTPNANVNATTAVNYGVGASLRLIGFDIAGGFIGIDEAGSNAGNTAIVNNTDKTVLGVKLVHDGSKDGKLIAGLNLALGYGSITTGSAAAVTGLYAYGEYGLDLGGFKITPKAYYATGGTANVLGFGATASIPLFGANLTAGGAIDNYADTATAAAPAKASTTWASVGLAFEQFFLPNSNFSVNFAYRADTNRSGTKFGPTWSGISGTSLSSGNFDLRDAFLKGWGDNGTGSGQTELGLYFSYGYYGLQFNYGVFQITPKSADVAAVAADVIIGQAFSISYKLKF
jgi:S-layer homology domain